MCYYYQHESAEVSGKQLINNKIQTAMKSAKKAAGLAIVAVVIFLTLNFPAFSQMSEMTVKTDFEQENTKRNYSEAGLASQWSPQNDYFSQEVTKAVASKNFMDVYREALRLNITRFKDVNDIQIGDTVIFPARTVGGTLEYWVADKAQNQAGKHDCIWRLTERYLANTLPTKPAVIVMPPAPAETAVIDSKNDNPFSWWIIIFAIVAIVALYYFFRNNSDDYKKRQRNPDTHPPVIPTGLFDSPEHAAYQIAQEYDVPFNNIISAQRVVLVRDGGVNSWKVQMQFNDTQREVDILPGETYTLITVQENDEQLQSLFRNHCGNKTGTIVSNGEIETERNDFGEVILPTGWRFVKEDEYIRPVQTPNNKTNTPVVSKTQENATPTLTEEFAAMAPVIDNNFVPAIMKALPKNTDNFDCEITGTSISISVKLK